MNLNAYFRWQANKGLLSTVKSSLMRYIYSFFAYLSCKFQFHDGGVDGVDGVDVLILHRSPGFKPYPGLNENLNGCKVLDIFTSKVKSSLFNRELCRPNVSVPFEFYIYAAYASYLVYKYRPKVIVVSANGAIYTPFLRSELNRIGGSLVHIHHSIPTANYRRFSLCDYDYSFVYGQSSIDAVNSFDVKLGECEFVKSGSMFVEQRNAIPAEVKVAGDFCVLLGSGPSFESSGRVLSVYRDLIAWSKSRSGMAVYIKPHPRSDLRLWNSLVRELDADDSTGILNVMSECRGASFAVAAYTNAVIDVADFGVPVIWMSECGEVDYFKVEEFFMPRALDLSDLFQRIDEMMNRADFYRKQVDLFRNYHLSNVGGSASFIAKKIKALAFCGEN